MSISDLDLLSVPVVDNHAHPLTRLQPETPEELRAQFSEAHSDVLATHHVESSLSYRWGLRQLTRYLGIDPSEEALLLCRAATGLKSYARDLVRDANLAYLLLDDGYPPPEEAFSSSEMEAILDVRVRRILRIETLVQGLVRRHNKLKEAVRAFDSAITGAPGDGYIALKSIAAYRTGLRIEETSEHAAGEEWLAWRDEVKSGGTVRLSSKLLLDFFVWRAMQQASVLGMPIQFHTGYGDPDLDLREANPLHLRTIFETAAFSSVPVILLHESYPYTGEAAYLASAYPNAYLDIAFSLPPLSRSELIRVTEVALGAAPASKLMVSSDGTRIPEHYWLGAVRSREVLTTVLDAKVRADEISVDEAQDIGRLVLRDNALRVYRLDA